MTRAEMDELGWDSCDVILATGGAFIDHPSFGMAVIGRLRDGHWLPPVAWQFVGLVASVCFVLITKALSLVPASLLAPFQFSANLWAGILGWIIWQGPLTTNIIIGNGIIIYRERRLKIITETPLEPIL